MVPEFAWLPPEINSARIFAGAGAGPLFVAASAWEGLAAELAGSASAFDAVIAGLTGGPWEDVGAMVGYDAGAASAAAELMPFSVPPVDLAGLASQVGAQVAGLATTATAAVSPALQGALAAVPGAVTGVQSLASSLPLSSVMQVAQVAGYPASMMLGPLMQLANSANAGTAGLAGASAAGLADAPKFVGDVNPMKGLGGGAGVGAGIGAELGKARLVGAMSVPPTWEGSMPKGLSSAAMAGLGGLPNAAELAQAAGTGSGMGMMPMPMGMGGAGAGMPGGMMGRGGANPHVVQARPSVIPRTGVG
ncbi:PPE family protein, SVP subgroup [Mycobacterium ostraviense]|uniref:PPE family protein, SVP subgroup n=1 Tax=Mycobacterium ostraviense TaxID=2738409 RepID=UPI000C07332B|nr:PPE domain-containing protein [Mycobacterium ostraviense]